MENGISSDPQFLETKSLLQRLIASVKVSRTGVFQNYPNPFNPETWIPYRPDGEAELVIRICSATGQLVRTLSLGHRSAGFYTDKSEAAYWDGRNESGEIEL